jgi:hypothetical protein
MIRKFKSLLALVFIFTAFSSAANEGMWIPSLLSKLNESEMKTMGLRLTAEDIYSINKSSLKDAIAQFGGGCTAEIISKEGLLLTNHHCGFSQIQSHSSVENDYLKNGFWAYNKKDELRNPGLTATFIVYIENVTNQVLDGTAGITGANKEGMMAKNISNMVDKATRGTKYEAIVKPFFYGNEYYMIVTKTYKDVRLVGAPPSSIGKFGGDVDNWVWPRHTGDFSIFRIYADAANEPSEISDSNVPYKPAHSLPISIKGVKEGDFAMVYGFPGRTQQYLPSYALDYTLNYGNPAKIAMRTASLDIIDAAMRSADKTRIQYAAKQSRVANAWKKWQGESRGLRILNAIENKKIFEKKFTEKAQAKGNTTYAALSKEFEDLYEDNEQLQLAYDYFVELVIFGPEILRFSNRFDKILTNYQSLSKEQLAKDTEVLQKTITGYFKDYDAKVDREIFKALIKLYIEGVDIEYLTPSLIQLRKLDNAAIDNYVDRLYDKSVFDNQETLAGMLKNLNSSNVRQLRKDPVFVLMKELYDKYAFILPAYSQFTKEVDARMELYVRGMMELYPDKRYWSDANSTLRLSYGKVEGSSPADGMEYKYYTTLDGIMEKYQPGNEDFDVPERLRELYKTKDYGPYGSKDGKMPVAFTASLHTTGGNSGSPVINGDGQLVGLNFDRSWESTMSDLYYSPEICRNIAMDTRYLLFVIDKYAGAKNLIDEMEIIR